MTRTPYTIDHARPGLFDALALPATVLIVAIVVAVVGLAIAWAVV